MARDQINCPKCGSSETAWILRGLPNFSDELERDIEAGRVILGGCMVGPGMPDHHCHRCQHGWTAGETSAEHED